MLIEPFRRGVMESLGLGPEDLLTDNPRLIYARLTGYGQQGIFSKRAGHDVNYVSLSGLLSLFGRSGEKPSFPVNMIADFGGGGMMCAMGIILALHHRTTAGVGQVVDCSMVEGSAYLGSWLFRSQNLPIWGNPRGENLLDMGAHFYETYETKDGKFMAVGAIEPQFYSFLLKGLGISYDEAPQYSNFKESKELFTKKFLEKTQKEWCKIFDDCDACTTPILSLDEAAQHAHNVEQQTFNKTWNGLVSPNPAPKLSESPGKSQSTKSPPPQGQHTNVVLRNLGYSDDIIAKFEKENICYQHKAAHL